MKTKDSTTTLFSCVQANRKKDEQHYYYLLSKYENDIQKILLLGRHEHVLEANNPELRFFLSSPGSSYEVITPGCQPSGRISTILSLITINNVLKMC